MCRGAGGSERTAVTFGSSLGDEEPGLRDREPGQEEALGAGEATFPEKALDYSTEAGE